MVSGEWWVVSGGSRVEGSGWWVEGEVWRWWIEMADALSVKLD